MHDPLRALARCTRCQQLGIPAPPEIGEGKGLTAARRSLTSQTGMAITTTKSYNIGCLAHLVNRPDEFLVGASEGQLSL